MNKLFNTDSWLFGLLGGAFLPLICALLIRFANLEAIIKLPPPSIFLLGLIGNLFMLRYFFGNGMPKTGRGIFVVSFATVLAIFALK